MAQSMIERHLASLEKQQQQQHVQQLQAQHVQQLQAQHQQQQQRRMVTIDEGIPQVGDTGSLLKFAKAAPSPVDDRYLTDSPMRDGEDITDTAVSSPMSASSVSSRRRSSTSHRRKSTPKKRQWEPAVVYSDGESAHEESYSDDPQDDLADSFSSSDDFRYRRQVSLDDEQESRLIIDERDADSPASYVSRDSVPSKDAAVAKETYFSKGTVVKDAIMAMRIKSESFDDYYQATMGRFMENGDLSGAEQNDAKLNAQNKSNRRAEHKCPFCHFVYTSVNYLLSHLYRVHFTVDPAELQKAIAGITAPFKNGQNKSTQYSRSPHMDERGHVVAPPASEIASVLSPLSLKTNYDCVDGDVALPPAKAARLSPLSHNGSRTSSPVHELNPKKRSSLACPKCHMRFSSRGQFETHIRNNTCTAVDYTFGGGYSSSLTSPLTSGLTSDTRYDCHLCGKIVESRYELDLHSREHRAPTPVRCDTCDLWFSDPKALDQHRQMHDTLLKCQFCGLSFNSMETLKRHTESHFNGKNMTSLPYNQQSSPASTDSDKENSPDQENTATDDKTSNSSRKLLLAELQAQDNLSENVPQNLTIPKQEPASPERPPDEETDSPFQHECTLCHLKCPDVSALVQHITKCHSNEPMTSKSQPYLPFLPPGLNSSPQMTNPLMNLGSFYPGMYMQNPLLFGNFDPKMFPMQPNILLSQLTKNATMEKTKYSKKNKKAETQEPTNNLMSLLTKEKKQPEEPVKMSPLFPNSYMPSYLTPTPQVQPQIQSPAPKPVSEEDKKQRNALIQQQNESEKPFSCGQCNKRFKRNCHLQLHKRTHTDDLRSYRCPQCGMRFIQLRSLEQHLKTHSIEKPYNCDYCGKKFAQKYNLKLHIRTHTGEKPYKCSYCEMRFADPGSLNRHTRTHTGEKPYSCDYCGKKFAQKYNLHLHIRVHTHDRPFRCVYCDKRFAQKSNLLMHLKLHVEYLQQLQNGTLPNMAELLDNGEKKGDGPILPSEAELRIIESERKKIEDELVALESAELADKILSEEGARREKAMIFNKDELAAMGKSGLALMGMDADISLPTDLVKRA